MKVKRKRICDIEIFEQFLDRDDYYYEYTLNLKFGQVSDIINKDQSRLDVIKGLKIAMENNIKALDKYIEEAK